MLEKLKREGGVSSSSTTSYRYNKELGVFERTDVGTDNWTEFFILESTKQLKG